MYRKVSRFLIVVGIGALGFVGFSSLRETAEAQVSGRKRPNILFIIADDMGYSDLGVFGGELPTPNLDALAKQGMMLTNFHTGPTCSPSRSMILTGVDNHRAGLGTMPDRITDDQRDSPAYRGVLNDDVVTVADLLKDGGYHTYMTGKWHLGEDEKRLRPNGRGFEESFAILEGGADHYGRVGFGPGAEANYARNGDIVDPPDDFYTTKTYTDMMIEFIEKNRNTGKPFFGYLAHTAPHEPLQVPPQYHQKYLAQYSAGWDQLREARFERQKELGIIPDYLELPPRWSTVEAWNSLSSDQRRIETKKMAVYAGMVEYMDAQIARLVDYLKEIGEYENTVIIYFTDNGASWRDFSSLPDWKEWIEEIGYSNSYENIGNPDSFTGLGYGWAQVMTTPHFGAKGTMAEGGTRGHFFVHYPGKIKIGKNSAFTSVKDLAPTALDYASVSRPGTTYKGRTIHPLEGKSMRPLFEGLAERLYGDNEPVAFELYGTVNKALYLGDWKILRLGDGVWGDGDREPWKLFNLGIDPTEQHDLSQQYPALLERMVEMYEQEEKGWGFIPVR
ncbi:MULTISPECIES: arylsulfatase [Spirulina sp. CCY15215]|uniref:arylsulfatase n=1 Tax=Spirulina sp. CCY15215 TaxID=2767591 RepID=UPI0019513307|nr:arylsulfatase [Spirulina major]